MLFVACNGIEKAASDVAPASAVRTADAARSVNVSQGEAAGIADMFLQTEAGSNRIPTKSSDSQSKRVSTTATVRDDGQDLMYVFNYEGGGFVIVGSTRNYYPILAYSDKGSFELQDDMGPVDVWLDETKVCIKNSSSQSAETKAQMQQLWARYDGTYVDPTQEILAARRPQTRSVGEDSCWARIEYLQSLYGSEGWTFNSLSNAEYYFDEWGFGDLYDQLCNSAIQNHSDPSETVIGYKYGHEITTQVGPLVGTEWYQEAPFGNLCPNGTAGCGPVAAAQVMFFHQYPDTLSWDGIPFTWQDVPAHYVSLFQTLRHPELMRMLGEKFNVIYYTDSTTSSTVYKVVHGLQSLGYTAYSQNYNVTSTHNELFNNHRPIIMRGVNTATNKGHLWVCEGDKQTLVNQLVFYTENQPYGSGTFYPGMYSYNNPGVEGGVMYLYFYMNWGWGSTNNYHPNGWFLSNNVSVNGNNYQNYRKNIYVSVQN